MAALGTNMGKKPEKKSESLVVKKPKKKVVKAKAKEPKKATVKPQAQKSTKKVVKQTKKVAAKPSVSKKPIAAKASAKPKESKPTKAQKPVKAKATTPSKAKAESAPKKGEQKRKLRNATLILEPSKRKKIRKTKVILEGDLSINNVDAFMSQIEPIFDDYDYVDFFQREVTTLDLCHVQMLYYFQNHPTRKGKTVTVNSELPTDLKKVVTNAGFKEFMFIPKLV